jgi:hypothetical protein
MSKVFLIRERDIDVMRRKKSILFSTHTTRTRTGLSTARNSFWCDPLALPIDAHRAQFLYELGKQETFQDQFEDCFKHVNRSGNGRITLDELQRCARIP